VVYFSITLHYAEEQYKKMVQDKTGGLFRLAVGLMSCFSERHVASDFTPLLNMLSLYFQIRDDFLNVARCVNCMLFALFL
jgi:geranylgeranyl diphosphate synthase type 3